MATETQGAQSGQMFGGGMGFGGIYGGGNNTVSQGMGALGPAAFQQSMSQYGGPFAQANAARYAAMQQAETAKMQDATARQGQQLQLQASLAPLQQKQQHFEQLAGSPLFSSILGNPAGFNVNGGGFSGGFGAPGQGSGAQMIGGGGRGGAGGAPGAGGGGGGFNFGGGAGNAQILPGPQFDTGPLFSDQMINQQVGNQQALNNQSAGTQVKGMQDRLGARGYGRGSALAESLGGRTMDANRANNANMAVQTPFGLKAQSKQYQQAGVGQVEGQQKRISQQNIEANQPFVAGNYQLGNALVNAFQNFA